MWTSSQRLWILWIFHFDVIEVCAAFDLTGLSKFLLPPIQLQEQVNWALAWQGIYCLSVSLDSIIIISQRHKLDARPETQPETRDTAKDMHQKLETQRWLNQRALYKGTLIACSRIEAWFWAQAYDKPKHLQMSFVGWWTRLRLRSTLQQQTSSGSTFTCPIGGTEGAELHCWI